MDETRCRYNSTTGYDILENESDAFTCLEMCLEAGWSLQGAPQAQTRFPITIMKAPTADFLRTMRILAISPFSKLAMEVEVE